MDQEVLILIAAFFILLSQFQIQKLFESWFEINYYGRVIPVTYFRQQLRMNRETFDELLDILRDRIQRQDSRFRNCIPAQKVLAIGLHRLAHGIPYHVLGTSLNVGKSPAIEATQDVVG